MGLSIEIRKFINSKNTGEFVDVTLPGELPARRAELRMVQKDNAAIDTAKRKVKELAAAKLTADKTLRAARETLRKTQTEFDRCSDELARLEKREEALKPEFEVANRAYDAARVKNAQAHSKLEEAESDERKADEAKHRAEQILKAATAASGAPNEKQKLELEGKVKAASDDYELKLKLLEAARAVAASAEQEYKASKAKFDESSGSSKKLHDSIQSATATKNTLNDKLSKLAAREKSAKERLDKLSEEQRQAEEETIKREGSVRPIKTRYETARFHYIESGKGEPLILIHGAGQSLYTFNKVLSKLALKYRVIALDLAGHGYSDRPNNFDYSAEDHAESLARFMDAMGIETAHFMGFSMGASYVLMLAALHPERVDKLIAISPGGITAEMPFSIRLLESGVLGMFGNGVFSRRTIAKLLDECVFDHTILNEHDIEQYANPFLNGDTRYCARHTVNAFDEGQVLSMLRNVESEVLLLWGDEDKWHTIEQKDEYLSALKNAKFNIVRNSGHLPQEERADRVCELVFDFIPAGYDIEV